VGRSAEGEPHLLSKRDDAHQVTKCCIQTSFIVSPDALAHVKNFIPPEQEVETYVVPQQKVRHRLHTVGARGVTVVVVMKTMRRRRRRII
jgi:hypothetical protein